MSGIELFSVAGTAVTLGDAVLAASTLIGGASMVAQGQAQKRAGEAAAAQAQHQASLNEAQARIMEQNAGQERAAAQRAAAEQKRQGRLIASRATAVSAASGGGALDPTVLDILSGIEEEADYRSSLALYQGEEAGRGLEYGAVLQRARGAGELYAGNAARVAGSNAASRSYLGAAGMIGSGAVRVGDRISGRSPSNTILSQGSGFSRYADQVDYGYYGYS